MGELGTVNVNAVVDINQATLLKLWLVGATLIVIGVIGSLVVATFKKA